MNRAARRLGHPASIPRAIMSRSPEALAFGSRRHFIPASLSLPLCGCLLNRSRDCSRSRVPPRFPRRRYADAPAAASFSACASLRRRRSQFLMARSFRTRLKSHEMSAEEILICWALFCHRYRHVPSVANAKPHDPGSSESCLFCRVGTIARHRGSVVARRRLPAGPGCRRR